ncbi:hypothetical protein G6M70_04285 [Agrobacterium tumefaciens]|uniref:hypothetical protein n=1 Tax=Agrobacterium tumefaciens TaxID=358 RepID=UPI001574612F|nr:hypothetical protein [Agrobacterium tumefaciens]NSZ04582.1 hypothetical protein [Agrobacterium tumefaciens]NSZ39918.1 hypothetical protein [Agrobacterium tumefaciens]NTB24836.1 hypothetical protein [Agrobacterium tumefaciens]NTB27666.1 hypothetical protein [Agrobacterium tumefaciens]NTB34239.1 hypothetical protein [Agrobacterium tumefaciens]
MLNRKTVKIGDIFQVLTSEGICYGQVTHQHPKWKFVIAIFREFFPKAPKDYTEVVAKEPQFVTTFLIQDAVKQGLFPLVANVAVPEHLVPFPTFRSTNNLKGDETMWFFWSGEKQWKVHRRLTAEEKKYPRGPSLPSAPLLIEMIEKNYRVEKDYI